MAFIVANNGDITLVQGDSGELTVSNIPTNRNYKIYFAIQDENRIPVGSEVMVESNYSDAVVIFITGGLTDLLTVPLGEETSTYYYGIKLCYTEDLLEDTLMLGSSSIASKNTITVYPRKVVGD